MWRRRHVSGSGYKRLKAVETLTLAATQRGEILGTAAYMSPEQAKGKAVDKRTDGWAFGACLYEALTGNRAFQGGDAPDTLAAVLRAELEWERLATTPRAIQRLLRRCLEREPSERLRDIGDARIEIVEAMAAPEGDDPTSGAVMAEKRSPVPLALAALAAANPLSGARGGSFFGEQQGDHLHFGPHIT